MSRKYDALVENNETYPKKMRVGRGFFSVLMLCLIAVGGVAATTFSDSQKPTPLDSTTATTAATTAVTTTTAKAVAVPPATTTRVTTTATTATTTTTANAAPLFQLPLSNKVLTPFSETPLYNETLDSYRAHTAVDFDGEEGQPVRPLASGTVCAVETDPLYGDSITIDHGAGVVSIYRGVKPAVGIGDEVSVDAPLGTLSSVPCESRLGPHLHLELYKDGVAVDAAALFEKQLIFD